MVCGNFWKLSRKMSRTFRTGKRNGNRFGLQRNPKAMASADSSHHRRVLAQVPSCSWELLFFRISISSQGKKGWPDR